jgi:hypothetical protein
MTLTSDHQRKSVSSLLCGYDKAQDQVESIGQGTTYTLLYMKSDRVSESYCIMNSMAKYIGTAMKTGGQEIWEVIHTTELAANIHRDFMIHNHYHILLSGRGRRGCGHELHVPLTVEKFSDRSNLVCIKPFAKLETINHFEVEGF